MSLCHEAHNLTIDHMIGRDTQNMNNVSCLLSSGPKLGLSQLKTQLTEIDF